jgi:hypothetical protein
MSARPISLTLILRHNVGNYIFFLKKEIKISQYRSGRAETHFIDKEMGAHDNESSDSIRAHGSRKQVILSNIYK